MDEKPQALPRNGTILSGYSVVTKSMIGAGIYVMAKGCSDFGIILGIGFLLLAASITWLSLRVLSKLALEYSESNPSFYSVSEAILPKYKWVLDASLVINCIGGCITFLDIAGNMMNYGLHGFIDWDYDVYSHSTSTKVIQLVFLVLLSPLCMLREITDTKIPNLIGMVCIFFVVGLTFVYSPCDKASVDLLAPSNPLKAFGSFPTFIFAYACQQNAFTVANEMKNPTQKKMDIMGALAVFTGLIIYLPVMILPLLTFGQGVDSIYLTNLAQEHKDSKLLFTGFIASALSVTISYVLLMHPIRQSLMNLIFRDNQPVGKKERFYRVVIVLVTMATTFLLAWALGANMSLPINIAGLLGGNTMCFVMPFALYLKKYGYSKKDKFSICVIAALSFCILLYPVALSGIIYKAASE